MSYFNQKRLYSPSLHRNSYSSRRSFSLKGSKKKVFFRLLAGFLFFVVVFSIWFTRNILIGLPDVSQIKDMVFSEATVIQDRN